MSLFPARRWIRNGLLISSAAILLACFAGGLAFWKVRASLPILEGQIHLEGLRSQVIVERDSLGVATVRGATQLDVDRGLGWVHGQERFFQMDLMRRQSAGELAELLGTPLVDLDLKSRAHQFRSRASTIVASLPPQMRERLDAYVSGVNQGLEALGEKPFEYLVLRSEPAVWRPEDSLLVLYSMFFVLNDESGRTESNNGVLFDLLPFELARFLSPDGTDWDASLTGEMLNTQTIPGPEIWDLRDGAHELSTLLRQKRSLPGEEQYLGSNNWAVSGSRTFDGRALVADDMHLETAVPNTWFRAQLEWIEEGFPVRVTGVTLPGTPGVTAGSNGTVAWDFRHIGNIVHSYRTITPLTVSYLVVFFRFISFLFASIQNTIQATYLLNTDGNI